MILKHFMDQDLDGTDLAKEAIRIFFAQLAQRARD
jgi:hypothetical protein